MKLLKELYYNCARLVPLKYLVKKGGITSLFPYHHIVSDKDVPHICHLYPYKNVQQFTQDLEFLLRYFDPIEPSDLFSYIYKHNALPHKKFLLTFDDGFREINEVVAPILKAKGVPAVFFINPAYIDNKDMFYRNKISLILGELKNRKTNDPVYNKVAHILSIKEATFNDIKKQLLKVDQFSKEKLDEIAIHLSISFEEYLEQKRPWLTTQELRDLSAQGFSIGAHSWNHSYYQKLTIPEQLKQTIESCNYVKQFSNKGIAFSFPHSDEGLSQQLFDQLLQPENGIDLLFGVQNQKLELNNKIIHRFNAERPGLSLEKQTNGILTYAVIQKLLNKQSIKRHYA